MFSSRVAPIVTSSLDSDLSSNERPRNTNEAQRSIREILFDLNNITEADEIQLGRTDQEWQTLYRRRTEKMRNAYAKFTNIVADQLYSSKYRFIYEMIQNADDSDYNNETPCLVFRIRPTEIVVESNELGFTFANVQALCATGQSSKATDFDTIGEKGLGFKSVFAVASKVIVQSGYWSFRFEYQRGDNGLGMISPIWTDVGIERLSTDVGTRFTLKYAQLDENFVSSLVETFKQLNETIIFGLKKIVRLVISLEGVENRDYEISFSRQGQLQDDRITLSCEIGNELSSSTFRVFPETLVDMPRDSTRPQQTTDIVLAFQVDPENLDLPVVPEIGQYFFAFLPVARMRQLPFIIQADFILAASREAIADNEWNRALLEGVALTFTDTILCFCAQSDPLRYSWMQYLPADPIEGIWASLYDIIKAELQVSNILESRTRHVLKSPTQLRVIPFDFLHQEEPLFPDIAGEDFYLSDQYDESSIEVLRDLGLGELSRLEMLDRVKRDISNPQGHLHSHALSDDWHDSFVELISEFLGWEETRGEVGHLPIIPLSTGMWVTPVSLPSRAVYLPRLREEHAPNLEIPKNLGLQKLHPMACLSSDRLALYAKFGVCDCRKDLVVQQILSRTATSTVSMKDDIASMQILFWYVPSHHELSWLAFDQNEVLRSAKQLFLPSDSAFDAAQLLKFTRMDAIPGYGFIHQLYLQSVVKDTVRGGFRWLTWLEKQVKINRYLPLTEVRNNAIILNRLIKAVATDNPLQFIASLRAHWQEAYKQQCSEEVKRELEEQLVLCRNGEKVPLSETILPGEQVLERSRQYNIESNLPFLKLPEDVIAFDDTSWQFLEKFGVICQPDADFYLQVLQKVRDLEREEEDTFEVCQNVYEMIAGITKQSEIDDLKKRFDEMKGIFVPGSPLLWYGRTQCFWLGPDVLDLQITLANTYESNPGTQIFFVNLLNLENVASNHILDEIRAMQSPGESPSIARMTELYRALMSLASSLEDIEILRKDFRNLDMIYANGRWNKPLQTIWNSALALPGRVVLEPLYPDLRDFFVGKVGVEILTAKVLLEELATEAKNNPPNVGKLREIILETGRLLSTDSAEIDAGILEDLRTQSFLPVQFNGTESLQKINGDYLIIDHERFGHAFLDKVNLLNFWYSDLTFLHPFIKFLKLEHHYLSLHVGSRTVVTTSRPSDGLTSHFRYRAFAFSCCAVSHRSSKYFNKKTIMHEALLNAQIFLSDDMYTDLFIKKRRPEPSSRSDRLLIKIDHGEQGLQIYAPSDPARLRSCYRTDLPTELIKILGIDSPKAAKQVYRILNEEALSIDDIMFQEDICGVSWLTRPSFLDPLAVNNRSFSLFGSSPRASAASVIPNPQNRAYSNNQSLQTFAPRQEVAATVRSPFASLFPSQQDVRETFYRRLLENVVRQAKDVSSATRSSFSNSIFSSNIAPYREIPTFEQLFGRDILDGNHRVKIGAAGELFVFERLRALGLSEFTLSNWRSRIRINVNVLPSYSDLSGNPEVEKSDLEYDDSTDQMQRYLENNAFNPFPNLDDESSDDSDDSYETVMTYFIEVKTTTGRCSDPFFMSQTQYETMEKHAIVPGQRPREIYCIFRVYNLLSHDIGMQIYIDPWNLRDDTLKFVSTWKVTPPEPRINTITTQLTLR